MSRITPIRFGLALPIVMMSQAALADLTPAQVWGDWRQYLETMGYQISAGETASGSDLTVSDITMSIDLPDNAGAMSMSMGSLSFVQNGDGSVEVVFPQDLPFAIEVAEQGDKQLSMSFVYGHSGHSLMVSGSPEEMTYDHTADSFSLTLTGLQVEDEDFGEENAKVRMQGTGLSSNTVMTVSDKRSYQQTGQLQNLSYDIAVKDPKQEGTFSIIGSVADLAFDGGGDIPMTITDASDMSAMMKAGFAVAGGFTYGAGNSQTNVTDPQNGNFAATTSTSGGTLGVEMSADKLAYQGQQNDLKMNVQVAELPFPIDISMAQGAFNLAMPVSKSDDPQDFAFGITMADFVMSDMIWSIFDPASQLPRDPATIKLDLSGQAKLDIDIMDPDAAAQMAGSAPGELRSLSISEVLVDAVGARLAGTGDVTFDNTDMTTFPGMPKPVGAVNLSLAGANGLMDKLVAMGLLPEEQAMGARMMMGLFAVPGDAPDTLKSTVEFTQDGQVLANGQRIK
ncbi:DUF2125 domain-containing protein [Sulfitobacter aestuariivivens]|uniref:DUF2125 domain-containing protein n=1 Tax=Sulfitobacter aestuariivivens TaxID=2766981 RepID=A0A927D5T5_9RHOB|nr:DUF2125 domain-containing protein [Sulfitobacter aestuariivivens]MBD3665658.1 DUF2125 domain-containing protein [Sulfitobacter aestuariivivens]